MNNNNFKSLSQSEIEHALSFIPAEDRDTWLKMAMAVKSELGEDGFELWNDWSQSDDSYNERDAEDVWESLDEEGGITIGSLIFEAKNHGWKQASTPISLNTPKKKSPPPQSSTGIYARKLRSESDWISVPDHPYAKDKGIRWPAGVLRGIASGNAIGENSDCIIVPIRKIATMEVVAVQCINEKGHKQTFGPVSGNVFFSGNTFDKSTRWFVVEGWADAVSMVHHHYDDNAVAFAAFGKGNMGRLSDEIVKVFSPDTVVIVEDSE